MELTHFSYKESTWELTQPIPLKEVNLLVGKNAVGKSKVIEAIYKMSNLILQQENPTKFFLIPRLTLKMKIKT